jgi:putative transcriptional regulator
VRRTPLAEAGRVRKDAFEELLDTARWLRQRRRARLVRLGLLRPGRRGDAEEIDVRVIRAATGLSQAGFAELLAIEVSTLRNWEQGRREPTGPARALLRALRNDPVAVVKALSA